MINTESRKPYLSIKSIKKDFIIPPSLNLVAMGRIFTYTLSASRGSNSLSYHCRNSLSFLLPNFTALPHSDLGISFILEIISLVNSSTTH